MTIPPSGPLNAKLAVVGQDWGWQEKRDQRQFVGAAGQLLTEGLTKAGLDRANALLLNVVEAQPVLNEWSGHDAPTIQRGAERVWATLAAYPRTLVVACGEHAAIAAAGQVPPREVGAVSAQFRALYGDSITNVRGYVYPELGTNVPHSGTAYPILPVVHPAFILRNWHPWWATFCWDLAKAARIVRQGAYQLPHIAWELAPSDGHFRFANSECLAVDIETSGTGCVAIAATANSAIVFPGKPAFDHPHAAAIQTLLESPIPKVFQNGQFDVTMLERVGWRVHNWQYDTMVMWHALEPLLAGSRGDDKGKPGAKKTGGKRTEKGLRFLASLLTDFTFFKDYNFQLDEQQFELCAKDAMSTWAIWKELWRRLETL